MRTVVLISFLMLVWGKASAQSLLDSALRYHKASITYLDALDTKIANMRVANPSDTTEGGDINDFIRKAKYREAYMVADPMVDSDLFSAAIHAKKPLFTYPLDFCSGSSSATWKCVGPFTNCFGPGETENQGRVNCVWVDPNHEDTMIVGTFGGVWKSTNGGHSWHNISDNISGGTGTGDKIPGTVGVVSLAVNPHNPDSIFVFLADWGGISFGLYYTSNGGNSWHEETSFNALTGYTVFQGRPYVKLTYKPGTDHLFACYTAEEDGYTYSYVLHKATPSSAWANITPRYGFRLTDFEFSIANPDNVIFSTNSLHDTAHLWTYNTALNNWTNLDIVMPSASDTIAEVSNISLAASDSVFMLASIKHKQQHLLKTPANTLSISILNNNVGAFEYLVVSPNNTKVIYASNHNATNSFFKSIDWGASFSGSVQGVAHADARCIELYKAAASGDDDGDVIYGGTDGGVVMKDAGSALFESITGDSLCITEFFGVSNAEGEDDLMIGGAQDNGTFIYMKNRPAPWHARYPGDDMIPKFARNGVKKALSESIDGPPSHSPLVLSLVDFAADPDAVYTYTDPQDTCVGFYWSSLNNNYRPWYVDGHNGFFIGERTVFKKPLLGGSWNPVFALGHDPIPRTDCPHVNGIFVNEADTNMMYVAFNDNCYGNDPTGPLNSWGRLFLTNNAYSSSPAWQNITPPTVAWRAISAMDVDPNHPNRIWVGLSQIEKGNLQKPRDSATDRVYYSPDYGATWYDVSSGLTALPLRDLKFRHGSNNELYCATLSGVYKCDFSSFNPAMTYAGKNYSVSWECFNDGLPVCEVNALEFNYCASKLRIATMGRGIWETDLTDNILPDELSVNTVWTTNKYMEASLKVKSGVTLTIKNASIFMPKNGSILVECGGHLILDSAVITNECEGFMWQGIIAVGNSGYPQVPTSNQG